MSDPTDAVIDEGANSPTGPLSPPLVRPTGSLLVLGLDLATTAGYAYCYHDPYTGDRRSPVHLGTWDLSAGPYDSGALRFARLRRFLGELSPDVIGYEDSKPQAHDFMGGWKGRAMAGAVFTAMNSAELFGALKATAAGWAEEHAVPCQGFGTGVIKKRATGKGSANKDDMVAACSRLFSLRVDDTELDNNSADASFVYLLAVEQVLPGVLKPNPTTPSGGVS